MPQRPSLADLGGTATRKLPLTRSNAAFGARGIEDVAAAASLIVAVPAKASTHLIDRVAWRSYVLPLFAFLAVAGYFALRSLTLVVPEGDSAFHLQLMQQIARGDLPKHLPFFAAVVGDGGKIEHFFPYSYPPLYHFLGAALYKVGGEQAARLMGPFFAGLIAVAIVYLLRQQAWPAVALALPLIFLHWLTQPILTWVYMEPMMLAFFLGGLCLYQRAWASGSTRQAAIAGALFGLAVATRQSALFYLAFVAVHGLATLAVLARRGTARSELKNAIVQYGAMAAAAVAVALPFLGYLVWTSGSLGYGEFSLPGMSSSLQIDPVANSYLSNITMPPGNTIDWLQKYWEWTLFTPRWQLAPIAYLPLLPFCVGLAYLWRRDDRMSKFLATYVPVHIVGEMTQLAVFHGNWRYIIASRMLFYAVIGVGIWVMVRWVYRAACAGDWWNPAPTGACAAALTIAALAPGFVTPGLVNFLMHQGQSTAEKATSFEELGRFVDTYVPEDSLILSGRWYTSGFYLHRNYTWVTYFGNAWVIDAISNPEPGETRATLEKYGIDYIVIQAPPPTYVDQMPRNGLRQIVLTDLDHFQLVFTNERTRLYRFRPNGIERQSAVERHGAG